MFEIRLKITTTGSNIPTLISINVIVILELSSLFEMNSVYALKPIKEQITKQQNAKRRFYLKYL